jgi:hypothetical protein
MVLGFLALTGAVSSERVIVAYLAFLLLGWAAGVTIGHLGNLLSLSLWVWWPPGPRPKLSSLYARQVWVAEAVVFMLGVELLGMGSLAGAACRLGGCSTGGPRRCSRSGGCVADLARPLVARLAASGRSERPCQDAPISGS